MSEYLIAGDSHLFAMGASPSYTGVACLERVKKTDRPAYFLAERWAGGRSDTYWAALLEQAAGRIVVLQLLGNQHFANFLLARNPLFDLLDPADLTQKIDPRAVVVPRRMVKALPAFRATLARDLAMQVRERGCIKVVICGTPPVRDDFAEAEAVRHSKFWQNIAADMGVDISTCAFTPAPVMRRLWGVLQECLEDAADEAGAQFLSVPQGAFDSEGYLATCYRGPISDFTHPNQLYGRLMLEHVFSSAHAHDTAHDTTSV